MKYEDLAAQLKREHGLSTQKEIADFFGVEQPAVAMWKSKGRVPALRVAELRLRQLEAPRSSEGSSPSQ